MSLPEQSPLGKPSAYKTEYDPTLLFPIPRQPKRTEIGLAQGRALPFFGVDIWNAYELSWLNMKGKPQVALASFIIPADTPNIVESKSFKLYLNSFNQSKIASPEALQQLLHHDLSEATGGTVQVRLVTEADLGTQKMAELDGVQLDRLDIETDIYEPAPHLLHAAQDESPVEETLVSHLLKSNCLVTGQPDWGSVQIRYVGAPINQEGLLKYLISFRNHNEFHEQCVERIFTDVMRQCKPVKLAVYARYTRRGGLDINPFRTNFNTPWPDNRRNARQ
ncbi:MULTISPECIES: NADPH-dependent 7-cyano-7-deazaguanine reductase QueF [Cupriavidus]|uniref:NADPH-dependent 7-cyano-7-deazaguanine reductase n=1 Tax=Cupriavidus basilensis TaxID=68895 RepID=A0A0C4Y4U8_9BURK|nr:MULTISPECIES: NADPH-dependent 7-cyano-7-deazaguanine reductase QueF [Cupriavidus]AJG17888.1 NADPH dependent preQ0 reductase [Cupriavidus basilensis]MBB1631514.1 NADPH-dependent 7-cyano-7-deazaguanine reductase QueF [Cupriavidus sp. UME77]MDR3383635.1 NADPH-dependent 7-cyano-7-deazaguanine reductase QueF [Cupriavidus basilensis]NUA28767.1 NADPH-dependent 7-cyano-7-deazaguanine reductase QueF [Cupriavidus basilensis]QOT76977.1 NADPH-dependent 7-cyano-7-deazaguanine reductase QueF [Cupriavidus